MYFHVVGAPIKWESIDGKRQSLEPQRPLPSPRLVRVLRASASGGKKQWGIWLVLSLKISLEVYVALSESTTVTINSEVEKALNDYQSRVQVHHCPNANGSNVRLTPPPRISLRFAQGGGAFVSSPVKEMGEERVHERILCGGRVLTMPSVV